MPLTRNEIKVRLQKLAREESLEDVRLVVDSFAQWTIHHQIENLLRSSTLEELQKILDEIAQEVHG